MRQTLTVTKCWPRLVLAPNHDPGRTGVMAAMEDAGVRPVTHLPRQVFLAVLKRAAALVGNSSAGLIEAAAIRAGGVPVVNIGDRQAGRERSRNVFDCGYGERQVAAAIGQALARSALATRFRHPFGRGDAGPRIARHLAEVDLTAVPLRKRNTY
jgi:UDP-N-acetylglucosamine 2-epimerase